MIGRIHSIDTFSTLDGPGVRTVVFMQGCHLRCKYCHNPDTWELKSVNSREYTPAQLMAVIRRSKPYFGAGGGVTFSGGEPLLHDEFIKEVFILCVAEKISTAIDSSLYIKPAALRNVLPHTDLVLADIKQMDNEKSHYLTGAGNDLNLQNLILVNESRTPLWIRYAVVPGWTDESRDVEAMAHFVAKLDMVERIDLLPYHSLGQHKWNLLNYKYELEMTEPPTTSSMQAIQEAVARISRKPVYIG